jgi:hypothetical protein
MQACAAKLCLNLFNYSETAVGQLNRRRADRAKFKFLVLNLYGFFSSSVYIWIYMVWDYFCRYRTQFNYVVVGVRNFKSRTIREPLRTCHDFQ